MREELGSLDLELKEMFMANKFDELKIFLDTQAENDVKDLMDYNWNIVKKYYEMENFELIMRNWKFVAFSCFMVEYAHVRGLISTDAFGIIMQVYNDIFEMKQSLQ